MSDCCNSGKKVLVYACSGGANVAEIADRAARELMFEGKASMFCLAGIGAGLQGMIQSARDADVNLLIDGCSLDCAKKCFERAGLTNFVQFRVTDLGIEKVKGVRAEPEQIEQALAAARDALTKA